MVIYSNQQYYEATLQLRPYNEEVYSFVLKEIDKRKDCLITKEEIKKYGVNLRLTSSRGAQALGKRLKEKFGGKLIKSRKLHGFDRQKSKLVYRITVCHRLD